MRGGGGGGGKFPVSVDHNNRAHIVIISCRALKKCFDCTSVGNESGKTIRRIDLVRPKPSRDLDAIAIRAAVVLEGAYGAVRPIRTCRAISKFPIVEDII